MSSVYGISSHSNVMSLWNCLCPKSRLFANCTTYVPTAQFMFLEDSLCTQSRVYALTVQFMYQQYSLSRKSTVYVPRVQLMSQQCSL